MMTHFVVGEQYPLFQKAMQTLHGQDGGLFESFEEGDGYSFTLFLNRPTHAEIDAFGKEEMKIRIVDEQPFCLPMIQFGPKDMVFEMSFDPTLYADKRALQLSSSNNLLMLALVDSSTSVVCGLRTANFPRRMMEICTKRWTGAFEEANYSERYQTWYNQKQLIPLERLWERALYVGKMGEHFNLSDIKKATD